MENASAESLRVYIWILSGSLSLLITLLILAGQSIAAKLGQKLERLLESVQTLTQNSIQQTEQIKTLFSDYTETTRKLESHGDRIRDIEIQCAKCCKDHKK